MPVTTHPGTVENGRIRLLDNARLPERTPVRVIVDEQPLARATAEILADIAAHRFAPDPGGPSVADLIREDRDR